MHLAHMIQIVGRVLAFWLLMIIAWYDTPFIGGRGLEGWWFFNVGLGIVIKCGTWRVLTMPTSLLSMQIRHLRWRYFELKALIRVVGLVASFPMTPISSHLDFYNSSYDLIFTPKKTFRNCTSTLTYKPFLA